MTELLYYNDGYLRETNARVIGIDGNGVILDRTVFYPEGGGQPGDTGVIGCVKVTNTIKKDGNVLHITEGGLELGREYLIKIDWDRRYHYMRTHSAQHLVSALLFKSGVGTVAVHHGENSFTIETDRGEVDENILLTVEEEAIRIISENRRIVRKEYSHEDAEALGMRRSIKVPGRVTVIEIENTDMVACGGVHTASTGEIGELCYSGSERIRGHLRTIWKCGNDAEKERRENGFVIANLKALLSSEREGIEEEVKRILSDNEGLKRKISDLERKVAAVILNSHSDQGRAVFESPVSVHAYEKIIEGKGAFIIDDSSSFIFSGSPEEFSEIRGMAKYSVKGGGRNIYRGSFIGDGKEFLDDVKSVLGLS